jgi:WD40 repeat protein
VSRPPCNVCQVSGALATPGPPSTLRRASVVRRTRCTLSCTRWRTRIWRRRVGAAVSTARACPHAGATDDTVQVWNATTGDLVYTYTGHHDVINDLAWSLDSKRIVSVSNDVTPAYKVHVWDATDGRHDDTYLGYSDAGTYVTCVTWSSDGARIATGSTNHTVQVWEPGD